MPETKRPFRADHVGSLIRPARLLEARKARDEGRLDAAGLRALEDECIREAIRLQEEAGLQSITDGEFRRRTWHVDFLTGFDNVVESEGRLDLSHRQADGTAGNRVTGMDVVGKLGHSRPIQVADFAFVKSETMRTPKACIPSPSIVHFRGGREAISREAYPDMADFYADLARVYREEIADLSAAGCRYLQLDDTNFAYLCDERFRDAVRRLGEDPDELPRTYCRLINDALSEAPADMLTAVHLCRGNATAGGAASGGYEPVAETLFNEAKVDAFFLEYDTERAGGFEPLRFLPKGKTVVLGLMTTKRPELESADALKRRIDEAGEIVPVEQICISPQCGFSSGAGVRPLTVDDERAKIARLVETARDVWGGM